MVIIVLGAIITLMQKDLLKAAVVSGITGLCVAFLYEILLAPDVALTQAIVGAAIVPAFIALAVKKTKRTDD
jgi:energy-converting hydrogenase B subunit D